MDDMKQYTVEVCEMKEGMLGAVTRMSDPMSLRAAFCRRALTIRELADDERLGTHAVHIVDAKGARF